MALSDVENANNDNARSCQRLWRDDAASGAPVTNCQPDLMLLLMVRRVEPPVAASTHLVPLTPRVNQKKTR
jgi:hypothetical protein